MRIDEAEGVVLRQRDALARRRHRRVEPRGRAVRRHGELLDRIEIEMMLGHVGEMFEPRGEVRRARAACTRPRWRSGSASAASRGMAPSTGMSRAAIASATSRTCRSLPTRFSTTPPIRTSGSWEAKPRTTAAADCDCPATSMTSSTGRPSRAARSADAPVLSGGGGDAVEQAHGALDDEEVGMRGVPGHQRIDQRRRHGPAVEIEARPPGRRGMKARVDIVGADLGRLHHDAAPAERRQQRQRQRGLAGARARRGDDEARARSWAAFPAVTQGGCRRTIARGMADRRPPAPPWLDHRRLRHGGRQGGLSRRC